MNESTRLVFEQIGISLLLGLLVGLQRQHSESLIAGIRTFPLISVLGTLAATFDAASRSGIWMVPFGFLGLAAIIGVSTSYRMQRENADLGITTEAALLLMYLVGASVVSGDRMVAIAVGAGVAVLLQFKPELHGIAARLGHEDLRAIMTFVLITCIVLPILPNRTYDLVAPLDVLNPFEIWTMVVLMVGISLGGYLIYTFLGRSAGILLGGLLGGAISSTATTVSYARRARKSPESSTLATVVIAIASTVVFVRVLLEISVVAPQFLSALAPPVVVMMCASAVASGLVWQRIQRTTKEMPQQQNPTELKSALLFTGLYAGILMALSAAKSHLGARGMYAVAILSGLTDMDAITLSASRLVGLGPDRGGIEPIQGWRVIVLAIASNLFFKWTMCVVVGQNRLAWQVGTVFAAPIVVGALLLWFWP
jgi:uncharacterized membrane protein (DUF4010 family)